MKSIGLALLNVLLAVVIIAVVLDYFKVATELVTNPIFWAIAVVIGVVVALVKLK